MSSLCFLVIHVLGNTCVFQVLIVWWQVLPDPSCIAVCLCLGRCTGLGWHEQVYNVSDKYRLIFIAAHWDLEFRRVLFRSEDKNLAI